MEDYLYLARKDNVQFYVDQDTMEMYADAGYTILRLEPVKVTNVEKEVEEINEAMEEAMNEEG